MMVSGGEVVREYGMVSRWNEPVCFRGQDLPRMTIDMPLPMK